MSEPKSEKNTDLRKAATEAHSRAWDLLEKHDRTPAESAAMIETALESLRLWEEVGTPANLQRGHWLVARAAVDAFDRDLALEHADATLDLTRSHAAELADFDLAFAEEVAARAYALAGNRDRATGHRAEAKRLGEAIADPGDRKEFFRQFDTGPWSGLV